MQISVYPNTWTCISPSVREEKEGGKGGRGIEGEEQKEGRKRGREWKRESEQETGRREGEREVGRKKYGRQEGEGSERGQERRGREGGREGREEEGREGWRKREKEGRKRGRRKKGRKGKNVTGASLFGNETSPNLTQSRNTSGTQSCLFKVFLTLTAFFLSGNSSSMWLKSYRLSKRRLPREEKDRNVLFAHTPQNIYIHPKPVCFSKLSRAGSLQC